MVADRGFAKFKEFFSQSNATRFQPSSADNKSALLLHLVRICQSWSAHTAQSTARSGCAVSRGANVLPASPSYWCLTGVSPVEVIKGQLRRPWELQCSCAISIWKAGLHQEAAVGVNELKQVEKIGAISHLRQFGFIPGTRRASVTWEDNRTGHSSWKQGHVFKQATIHFHGQS